MKKWSYRSLLRGIYGRFRLLSWPLDLFDNYRELKNPSLPFGDKIKRTRYPSRAMRYWWVACAIQEECQRLERPLVIVDAGCERGILKQMTSDISSSRWIGLDKDLNNQSPTLAGYDEIHSCDLEKNIPLLDSSADIVVCLHVLEHIARFENAIKECVRVLRPNGILLIGTPILPRIFQIIRQWQFSRQFKRGKRRLGAHFHAFSPAVFHELTHCFDLKLEFMTGLRFLRWSGSKLENWRIWVRLNQIWGAIFPSLGREICIQYRHSR